MVLVQKEVKAVYIGTTRVRPSGRLPSGYQEVERIGSSGTQYINTGYTPTVNTVITAEMSGASSQSETWGVFFGVTGNDRSSDGVMMRIYNGSATTWNPRFCNSSYSERQITGVTTDTFHTVILQSGGGSLDGTSYTVTTSGTPYSSSIDIFGGNNGGSHGWRKSSMKLASFTAVESGTTMIELVPCYRTSDSVIGLYDIVNDVFYTNQGSGTFTKGDDV